MENKSNNNFNPSIFSNKVLGLVNRDREIKQLMYALFTKEHMLMMGPPGTAKSLFAMRAFSAIDGADTFQIHLTKQTTEEYVFGPLNIIELKKGNLVHNIKDSILTADFAFLDEFFDASDVLLRSLLGVLNERVWLKGSQEVPAKLHTAILTSNYQRESDVTQAVLDRIIFKAEIPEVTAKSKRLKIYRDAIEHPDFKVSKILSLKKLQKFVKLIEEPHSVKFPKHVLEVFDTLLKEFVKESKKYISQRTANKSLKVLKTSALLDNRDEVSYGDLEELKYVFCVLNRQIEEEIFDAVYERCVGSAEEEKIVMTDLEEIENKIKSMPTNFDDLDDKEFIDRMRELNEYNHCLEDMVSPTKIVTDRKDKILDEIRKIRDENKDKLFKRK